MNWNKPRNGTDNKNVSKVIKIIIKTVFYMFRKLEDYVK